MNDNLNKSLDFKSKDIDKIIEKVISKYIFEQNINLDKPISLNIQFSKEDDDLELIDDFETFIESNNEIIITMYSPYNLNKIRFDVISENKIIIKNYDYSFYKQFWFSTPIIKESLIPTFRNNILEFRLFKKKEI
jgi:hypothetical protein